MITTVLFDLDGILVRSWPLVMATFTDVCTQFGLDTSRLNHPRMKSWTLHEAYAHLSGRTQGIEKFFEPHNEFQLNNLHLIETFSEVHGVLETLRERKKRIGVVTNRLGNTLAFLTHKKLDHFVELIIGANDVKNPKPHPEGIILAMETLHAHPDETVMVGDAPSDIYAGKAASTWTIAIDTNGCYEGLLAAKPDFLLKDMSSLPELVETL